MEVGQTLPITAGRIDRDVLDTALLTRRDCGAKLEAYTATGHLVVTTYRYTPFPVPATKVGWAPFT
jgi:hypothetical protein